MRFFRLTPCNSAGIRQFHNLKIFSTVEFIGMETMVKYSKEVKEQALLQSDEQGVKKAAEQLGSSYYPIADWRTMRSRKPKEEENRIGQNAIERAGACHAERNTGTEKGEFYLRQPNTVSVV